MLLIKNARVWRNESSVKGWIGVDQHGLIDAVGTDEQKPPESSYLTVLDANDNLVLPGLHDAHIHVMMTGESSHFVDLKGCTSILALQKQLMLHVQQAQESIAWIQGVNWDQTPFGRYPTRHDLDAVSSTRPIFLWRACWHIGVANTKALELSGILTSSGHMNPSTICPPGGVIDTYEENGIHYPSGILRERAVELVVTVMNTKTPAQCRQFIEKGLEMCVSHGLTSVQTNDEGCYQIYQQLQSDNKLPIRVFLTPNYDEIVNNGPSTPPTASTQHDGMLLHPHRPACMPRSTAFVGGGASSSMMPSSDPIDASSSSSKLIIERVKIFSDGSLGAETAALRTGLRESTSTTSHDDSNSNSATTTKSTDQSPTIVTNDISPSPPSFTGVLIHEAVALRHMISNARSLGFRVEIHAIGDAAAEQVLHAMETAGVDPSERPVLTHCQILGEDLVSQMKRLGVLANVQPSFVPTDMHWINKRGLSTEAWPYAYAWKTLLDVGVAVAGGSDAPIETCNPFVGMFDAMYRTARIPGLGPNSTRTETDKSPVFRPEECLTFAEAVALYTTGAAFAAHSESFLGKIEVGYFADFVVVDYAIMGDPWLLQFVRPNYVIVGGKVEYDHNQRREIVEESFKGSKVDDEGNQHCDPITADAFVSPPTPGEAIGSRGIQSTAFFPGKGGAYHSFRIPPNVDETIINTTTALPTTITTSFQTTTSATLPGHGWSGRCACRLLGRYCGIPNDATRQKRNTTVDIITTSDSDNTMLT